MTNQSFVINDSSLIADPLTRAVATENQTFALPVISHPTDVEEWRDVYVGTNLAEKILVQSPNPGVKSNVFLRTATVHAGGGDDFVVGSDFTDVLYGDHGQDRLLGGNGDDVIDGGNGNDVLTGGQGADIFWLSEGFDVVTDFTYGNGPNHCGDRISLHRLGDSIKAYIIDIGDDVLITGDGFSMKFEDAGARQVHDSIMNQEGLDLVAVNYSMESSIFG